MNQYNEGMSYRLCMEAQWTNHTIQREQWMCK